MKRVLHQCGLVMCVACVACQCVASEPVSDQIVHTQTGAEEHIELPPITSERIGERVATAIDDPDLGDDIALDQSLERLSESLRAMFAMDRFESTLWVDLCAAHAAVNIGNGDALTHSLAGGVMAGAITVPGPSAAIVLGIGLLAAKRRRRRW